MVKDDSGYLKNSFFTKEHGIRTINVFPPPQTFQFFAHFGLELGRYVNLIQSFLTNKVEPRRKLGQLPLHKDVMLYIMEISMNTICHYIHSNSDTNKVNNIFEEQALSKYCNHAINIRG